MDSAINIVIGSAGRRLYLIRWFREAFKNLGVEGRVIVTEADTSSASFTAGDLGILMPKYSDPAYETALLDMVDKFKPAMFLSVNDWELAALGRGLGDKLRRRGVLVPGLPDQKIARVTDKFQLATTLGNAGIATPRTVLASDQEGLESLKLANSRLVVKHRCGSGSSGLNLVESSRLEETLKNSLEGLTGTVPGNPLDEIVVQPLIEGDEFGVDIVGSFSKEPRRMFKVLVREKLRMRAGETDKAVTVAPEEFLKIGQDIGGLLDPTGLIDVDVLRDSQGQLNVIDINPRFGGGYPFVHLAGADVPKFYTSVLAGKTLDNSWASYESGVISAKFEETRVSGSAL